MDKLILKYKFQDITNEEQSRFNDEFNSISSESVSEDYIICVFDALREQILKYNPSYRSNEFYMISRCVKELKNLISQYSSDKIEKNLVNFLKILVQTGWTATNCDLILTVIYILSSNYFENLSQPKFLHHLSVFDELSLSIHPQENSEHFEYIRREQKRFVLFMFMENFKDSLIDQHRELFEAFIRNLYLRSWIENEEETEIYSCLGYRLRNNIRRVLLSNPDNFLSLFTEISTKLVENNVSTKSGRSLIDDFFCSSSDVFSKNKEKAELFIDIWAKSLFSFLKLKQPWMKPVLRYLARDIRRIEPKYSGIFQKCKYLINDAIEFVLNLQLDYPNFYEENTESKDALSEWCDLMQAMTEVFLPFTLQTSEEFQLLIPCLTKLILINTPETSGIFASSFNHIEKSMQTLFKLEPKLINLLIDSCVIAAFHAAEKEDTTIPYPFKLPIFRYQDYYDKITQFGKLSTAFNSPIVQENLRENFLKIFNRYSVTISVFLGRFSEFVIFKHYTPDQMLEFIQAFNIMIDQEIFRIYNPLTMATGTLIKNLGEQICNSPTKYSISIPELIKTCKICLKNGLQWENASGEVSFNTNSVIILYIFQPFLATQPVAEYTYEFYLLLFESLSLTDESHSYYSTYISYVGIVPMKCSNLEILIPCIPYIMNLSKIIADTNLGGNIMTFLMGIQNIFKSKPTEAIIHFEDLDNFLTIIMSDDNILQVLQFLSVVYEEFPEKIHEEFIQYLWSNFSENTGNCYYFALLNKTISKTHSQLLTGRIAILFNSLETFKLTVAYTLIEVFVNIMTADSSHGEEIFLQFENIIEKNKDNHGFCNMILNGYRQFGLLRHDLLVKYKEKIEGWQKYSASYHDVCQHLLDVIADRSLAQLDHNINQQGKEIERLDNEMESQKEQVDVINKEVNQQKVDLEDINKRVDESEVQIDTLKQDVKEISEQVEEIDLKTVSSAPKWAREVSKLLNPPSDDDWKLLAQRLGYNTEDIRGWSTHSDPCMSLLSDWFAVRRNVEATRAILEQLVEMNRNDAARIVEDALTVAEAMISDDEPIEFITPPLIFLSYQWSNQEDVKILREHLQKAGYRCWMDIGQMGGGDKLYEAIDRGIRGAKVFVCCVSKKYSESPNCKRELNLAISLHKSVIPLQMEKMDWPPVGTMGPLLTEYIFIRMFARPGAEVISGTFWPYDRFQELLMQIRYSCAPEYELVDENYLNWWVPPENKTKKANLTDMQIPQPDEQENEIIENPQIFISYQWGKQEEVKKLKSTLTKLGYSCWMDVYQMGGGDSLYDKIDRGLRGCKLMISCVTPKYSESPNCRRELSLCDGLKKPIIAIMLERMTWPPEGPMSMILSPLSYISFVDSFEEQQNWNGMVTSELLCRIKSILSESICDVDVAIKKEVNEVSKVSCSKQDFVKARNSIDKVNQRSKETLHAVSGAPKSKSCIII